MEIKKKVALIAAGSLVSAGALFAVVTNANAADTTTAPSVSVPSTDANEANDPTDANDGNWKHDANEANDPADANEANDPADANEANDPADANEGSEGTGK